MTYLDECQKYIQEIVNEEFAAIDTFIKRELVAPTWEQLDHMAFDASLKEVKKLEEQAFGMVA